MVYLDYTQAELDAQYNQATLVPDISNYLKYWNEAGEVARNSLICKTNIPYGKSEVELLDIFRGIMPFLAIVILAMFLMYMFPGIALWLPETLFAD